LTLSTNQHIIFTLTCSVVPGATFVDVGANLRIYALIATRIAGHLDRVIAFELSTEASVPM